MSVWTELALPYAGTLAHGALVTLELTACFISFGTLGAIGLIALRYAPLPLGLGRLTVRLFVMYHRNVPMVVQLLFWYFGAPELLPDAWLDAINRSGSEFIFSVLALSLCFAAYLSEDLRSGIDAVPQGQLEAAQTLGLPYTERLRFIVLPQALRTAWPAIASQTVLFFKATSLAAAIGVTDLASVGQTINNNSFRTLEAFALISLIYVLMSWLLASALGWAEQGLRKVIPQ